MRYNNEYQRNDNQQTRRVTENNYSRFNERNSFKYDEQSREKRNIAALQDEEIATDDAEINNPNERVPSFGEMTGTRQ